MGSLYLWWILYGDVYVTEEGVEANVEFTSCRFSCSPPK